MTRKKKHGPGAKPGPEAVAWIRTNIIPRLLDGSIGPSNIHKEAYQLADGSLKPMGEFTKPIRAAIDHLAKFVKDGKNGTDNPDLNKWEPSPLPGAAPKKGTKAERLANRRAKKAAKKEKNVGLHERIEQAQVEEKRVAKEKRLDPDFEDSSDEGADREERMGVVVGETGRERENISSRTRSKIAAADRRNDKSEKTSKGKKNKQKKQFNGNANAENTENTENGREQTNGNDARQQSLGKQHQPNSNNKEQNIGKKKFNGKQRKKQARMKLNYVFSADGNNIIKIKSEVWEKDRERMMKLLFG